MIASFEPFFTTKVDGRSSGTGLGLATVYGVLQLHRGAVQVTSAPGQGTTFLVWLPKGALAPKSSGPLASVVAGRGLVLIVDDEEMLRSLHADMVESLGYSALVAADGAEGVEMFRRRHRELAAVLLDLKMPVLDGGQAFLDMHAINPGVSVILCSGFGDNEEAQGLITQGARGLLAKPFRLADLAAQLERRSDATS